MRRLKWYRFNNYHNYRKTNSIHMKMELKIQFSIFKKKNNQIKSEDSSLRKCLEEYTKIT